MWYDSDISSILYKSTRKSQLSYNDIKGFQKLVNKKTGRGDDYECEWRNLTP